MKHVSVGEAIVTDRSDPRASQERRARHQAETDSISHLFRPAQKSSQYSQSPRKQFSEAGGDMSFKHNQFSKTTHQFAHSNQTSIKKVNRENA